MKQPLSSEISIFVRIFELGTFAAVAQEAGYTSSGISRIVSRLEDRLGVKLLHRSTRRLVLTPEGEIFLRHARNILTTMESAEADLRQATGQPSGHLKINCGTAFAHHKLAPNLPKFIQNYPEITIDVSVGDRRIDPILEQVDVTIRVGALADSDLIAIRLGTVRRVIAASPHYLAAHGTPGTARDLLQHDCLLLTGFSKQAVWPMYEDDRAIKVPVTGTISSDSADTLLHAAIAGAGIIRLGDFLGSEALADGQLVQLLNDCHDDDPQPITALVPHGRQTNPRVRAFLDFLKAVF